MRPRHFPLIDVTIDSTDTESFKSDSCVLAIETRVPMQMFDDYESLHGVLREIGRSLLSGRS